MSLNDEPDDSNLLFYNPVTLLGPLSRLTGINLDQLNFVVCLLLSFPIGYWYRIQLQTSNRTVRAAVTSSIGLAMCYFCYGNAILHLFINGFGSYLIMKVSNPKVVHIAVFAFSMGYLILIHAYRWMYQKTYCLDVTGSMMVSVGKITLLATAVHDGMGRKKEELLPEQARDAIKTIPNVLDFVAYMFNFQSVICGPMNHYSTFSSFLDVSHVPIDKKTGKPYNPNNTAVKKFEIALVISVVYSIMCPLFPMSITSDPEYNNRNILIWWVFHALASTAHRLPYYFAWIISDSICNISGFGFDGIDEKTGKAKWSKTTNVRPMHVECGMNYKEMVDNWNIWTVAWLRRVVYERIDGSYKTVAVYATGAAWHGLAIGYYLSFLSSALFTLSAATFRRCMRHRFIDNPTHKLIYDIVGCIACKFIIGYVHYPFYVMHFWPSLFMYRKLYMAPQIIAALIYFYLPMVYPPLPKTKSVSTAVSDPKLTDSTKTAKDFAFQLSIRKDV